MQNPPKLLVAAAAPVVGAVSVLCTSVAAPGVGFALRIWSWEAGVFAVGGVAALARFALANPAGSSFSTISFSYLNGSGLSHHFEGGLIRPANEGVSIFGIASAGGNTYYCAIRYTVEKA